MSDRTKTYDYERLIEEEKAHYTQIELTEDLKEGGIHAHDAWHYYWKPVQAAIAASEVADLATFLERRHGSLDRPISIISLGSGYCGHEIDLARRMRCPYRLVCTDINETIFGAARAIAEREQLAMEFTVADLNFPRLEPAAYDLVFAHASLHHVINLENLFDQIAAALSPRGVFHLVEVLGMNRKLIWDENEAFANSLLDCLHPDITAGIRLATAFETSGMEGIRQEDILPLIRTRFRAIFEVRHGAFMRFICTHPDLGKRLNPGRPRERRALDFLMDCDASAVRHGILRPLEIWGVYTRTEPEPIA